MFWSNPHSVTVTCLLQESYLRSSVFSNHLKYNKQAGVEDEEAAEDQSRTEKTQLLVKLFAVRTQKKGHL